MSTAGPAPDAVEAITTVSADPETAFEVFTAEVDAWWKHGPRFRTGARGESCMRFEPGVGGRLLEVFEDAADPFVLGRITVWDPPGRLGFEMGGRDLRPGEKTEVEVRFESVPAGTRVSIVHRGWSAFPPGHPVRHGLVGEAFGAMMGLFWGDLLVSLAARARRR